MIISTRPSQHWAAVLVFAVLACVGMSALADDHANATDADEKIAVAILTGQNNHQWFNDAPALKSILDATGLFETTLVISPDKADPDKQAKWDAFEPAFADYDVVVLNYNDAFPRNNLGDHWPDRIKRSFEQYVAGGGKVYSHHAANNAFKGWDEYEKMIGLLWRRNDSGKRVYLDDQGNRVVQEVGRGRGSGHGDRHSFVVEAFDDAHPLFEGLPNQWMHAEDELFHAQRGPAENMTILLTAYSDAELRGTGVIEPVMWTTSYGEGTVMTNVLGHWAGNGPALQCVGFQTIFTRGIEWLATGEVTQGKPDDFPTAETASKRPLEFEPIAHIDRPDYTPAWARYAEMIKPSTNEQTASAKSTPAR